MSYRKGGGRGGGPARKKQPGKWHSRAVCNATATSTLAAESILGRGVRLSPRRKNIHIFDVYISTCFVCNTRSL